MWLPVRAAFGSARTEDSPGFVVTSHHNANVLVKFEGDDRAVVRTSVYAWHQMTDGGARCCGATTTTWSCGRPRAGGSPSGYCGWRVGSVGTWPGTRSSTLKTPTPRSVR
jgi:hypothetical protein